jgi:hypothetical protein
VIATAARATPVASPDGAGDDAELIAACRDFHAAEADRQALEASDMEDDAISDPIDKRWYAALERLTAIRAQTAAGIYAKAGAAHVALESTVGPDGLEREEDAALAALADLVGHGRGISPATTTTTAHGTPDAVLIALCAEFDECQRQLEALYEVHPEDDPPGEFTLVQRQFELSRRIRGMRVHSADGILAIARSVAVHNGNGGLDFDPTERGITAHLMTALMRETCLLSGLPAPSKLAGRAIA